MSSTSVQKIVAELKALPKADFEEVMTTVYGSAWTDRHEPEEELEECENCGELCDLEDGHCEKCHDCEDCGAHDMGFNDDSEWVCPHCEEDNKEEEDEQAIKLAQIAAGQNPDDLAIEKQKTKQALTHDITGAATAITGDITSVFHGKGGFPSNAPPAPPSSGPMGIPVIGWLAGGALAIYFFFIRKK